MADFTGIERFGTLEWQSLRLEQLGSAGGHCDCCGTETRRVWGLVHRGEATVAAYFVTWTLGRADHAAAFDLIVGPWGEATNAEDRAAICLEFRAGKDGGSFMVVDAGDRLREVAELAGRALARHEVVGRLLAQQVFAIVDAVYMTEPGLDEIRGWP